MTFEFEQETFAKILVSVRQVRPHSDSGLTESTLLRRTAPLKHNAPHAAVVFDCDRMSRCQTVKACSTAAQCTPQATIITELANDVDRPRADHHE